MIKMRKLTSTEKEILDNALRRSRTIADDGGYTSDEVSDIVGKSREVGAVAARAAIVAWLRIRAEHYRKGPNADWWYRASAYVEAADAIERGEHERPIPEPEGLRRG